MFFFIYFYMSTYTMSHKTAPMDHKLDFALNGPLNDESSFNG